MAHRLAELMAQAETADGEAKTAAEAEVQALILELWSMRTALPGQVDPDKRLGRAIRALEQLNQERSIYQRPHEGANPALNAAAKARQDMATLNAQLAVLLVAEDFDRTAEEESDLPLSPESLEFREKLDERMLEFIEGRVFFRSPEDKSQPLSNKKMVKAKIAGTLDELRASLLAIEEALKPARAEPKRKRASKRGEPFQEPSYRKI